MAAKAPCAAGNWADGRQYRRLCYSDIVALYGTERMQGDRLPYLDPCPAEAGTQCDEYPVLTMYLMRFSAWISDGYLGFFYANSALLAVAALATSLALYRISGPNALYFALAPTLLIYAFINWDLLAVALAAGATLSFLRGRDAGGGALLGLGAAAKLYPALLLIPFALERLRQSRPIEALRLCLWAAGAYVAVNLPFFLLARPSWTTFFRFNAERPADWDSLWYVVCQRLGRGIGCPWSPRIVNLFSLGLFLAVAGLVWIIRRGREPGFPRWTFAFPLLVVFLLTSKVYSPQFGLWLLPWFALGLPNPWLFAAFGLTDVAVFVTRFTWFGRLGADLGDPAFSGFAGVPIGAFQLALLARAAVLVACLATWALGAESRRVEQVGEPLVAVRGVP